LDKRKLLDRQQSPRENLCFYFSAAAGLALVFAAGLACVCSDARRARVLTRLAAWDRLRVFLRALVFGMVSSSPQSSGFENGLVVSAYILAENCQNRRNCQKLKIDNLGTP